MEKESLNEDITELCKSEVNSDRNYMFDLVNESLRIKCIFHCHLNVI